VQNPEMIFLATVQVMILPSNTSQSWKKTGLVEWEDSECMILFLLPAEANYPNG